MYTNISLRNIPTDILYEGYLWWSDNPEPIVYFNDKPLELPVEGENPFIIEGNLWNKSGKISYLIRFIDGQYMVYKFDLSKRIPRGKFTIHNYLPNRIKAVKKIRFIEVWEVQSDPLCYGFDVLKPAYIAFVGFKY